MDFVGAVIRNKIKELGQLWKSSENHVNVSIDVLNSWDTLISEWAEDESMPLIIRKGSSRGQKAQTAPPAVLTDISPTKL